MASAEQVLELGGAWRKPSRLQSYLRIARRKYLGTMSAVVILVLITVAIFAPIVAPHDPLAVDTDVRIQSPNLTYLLGTDELGRDILSRILYGSRVSLFVAIVSTLIGTAIGLSIGLTSAYFGGKYDLFMQRFIDSLQAFPNLILALVMVATLGASLFNVTLAIAVGTIPIKTRVVRGTALGLMGNVYVEAARAIGCSGLRIMVRHILPNAIAPIIVMFTISLGAAILAESSLSFLGLGPPPPNPTWGSMISGSARSYMRLASWIVLAPGVALTLVVVSFNLLGDAVRDVLDPRLRGSR